jgi:hypothetical protein
LLTTAGTGLHGRGKVAIRDKKNAGGDAGPARRVGLLSEPVRLVKGWFADTVRGAPNERIALLRGGWGSWWLWRLFGTTPQSMETGLIEECSPQSSQRAQRMGMGVRLGEWGVSIRGGIVLASILLGN